MHMQVRCGCGTGENVDLVGGEEPQPQLQEGRGRKGKVLVPVEPSGKR
jgi:hypothetical protein